MEPGLIPGDFILMLNYHDDNLLEIVLVGCAERNRLYFEPL